MKEQSCFNYFPGDITYIDIGTLDSFLLRDGIQEVIVNGIHLGVLGGK